MKRHKLTHHGHLLNRITCPHNLRTDGYPQSTSITNCETCPQKQEITETYVNCNA